MIEVDRNDPAFSNPTKPIGPMYTQDEADALAAEKGWTFKPDADGFRRVVPSPLPQRIFGIPAIRTLLDGAGSSSARAAAASRPVTPTSQPCPGGGSRASRP